MIIHQNCLDDYKDTREKSREIQNIWPSSIDPIVNSNTKCRHWCISRMCFINLLLCDAYWAKLGTQYSNFAGLFLSFKGPIGHDGLEDVEKAIRKVNSSDSWSTDGITFFMGWWDGCEYGDGVKVIPLISCKYHQVRFPYCKLFSQRLVLLIHSCMNIEIRSAWFYQDQENEKQHEKRENYVPTYM